MKSFCFECITSIREKKSLSNYKYHHYLWQVSVEIEKKDTHTDNGLREKKRKRIQQSPFLIKRLMTTPRERCSQRKNKIATDYCH